MKILVDADGCPVVDIVVKKAKAKEIRCILICDSAHYFAKDGAETFTVSTGADSVDYALVNMIEKDDIVITQDYGLAAMCLAKKALVVNQDGKIYDNENISGLLESRHIAKKIRNSGGRIKGNSKRKIEQDVMFENTIDKLINI